MAQRDQKLASPLYFQGIPGSGKTYAAKSMAKSIAVPLASVNLDGATIDGILGTSTDPGRLLLALSNISSNIDEKNYKNTIFFIDEFDRLLNRDDPTSKAVLSTMLKIFDPTNRKFFSPYLNAEISLPPTIILAGNYAIKDEALKSRFQVIEFGGFSQKLKQQIAINMMLPSIADNYQMDLKKLKS